MDNSGLNCIFGVVAIAVSTRAPNQVLNYQTPLTYVNVIKKNHQSFRQADTDCLTLMSEYYDNLTYTYSNPKYPSAIKLQ